MSKDAVIQQFRAEIRTGRPLIGSGAGTGLSAKTAENGGADFLVVYNSGRYRMAGRGSLAGLLAYGDANAIVLDMAGEVIPVVSRIPVFAGVNGTDPFRVMPAFLKEVKAAGYSGVQNFPTVGAFDGIFRENLESTGMGYDKEVAMMREAGRLGLVTAPYAFTEAEAEAMVKEAEADVLVAHMGLTSSGTIGASAVLPLDDAVARTQQIADAARRAAGGRRLIVLAHGGPIATPEDWQYVLERVDGVDGFLGASSMERLPAEQAITETVARFKTVEAGVGR
ncbi:phosphoenolpyruvate hydrolase family protein [Streptomyces sp. AHA2]|uniref:phosphoenolpyruvate hydrolase family protein n=1 Tax=Streptomyces sp. AHA2 TaxID=3064526 RepID=UPI002FE40532